MKTLTILELSGIVILLGIGIFVGPWFWQAVTERGQWKSKTIPVDNNVKLDICTKFEIENQNLCEMGATTYGPDFFPYIKKYFPTDGKTTRQMVDAFLGEYLIYCEDSVTLDDGTKYYRCLYDLVGDDFFPIVAFYNDDESLFDLINNTETY